MSSIRLINVDLPAPDGPRSTPVRAGWSSRRISSTPSPVTALVTTTGVPIAAASSSARKPSTDSAMSAFVSSTTGTAPLCHAMVRYLSIRRAFTFVAAATTNATSMFAASGRAVVHQVFRAVVGDDPRGHAAIQRKGFELFVEVGVPAQHGELVAEVNGQREILREKRVGGIDPPGGGLLR